MRTTLGLPDSLLRNLKIQAAQGGKSLKTLLNELFVRAMAMPAVPAQVTPPTLPVLSRLSDTKPKSTPVKSSAILSDVQLQDDLDKLRRSCFIQ